ncbi:MAG TPA: flippase, partial [Gemmatimonadaceae bacterium]|nr:flippase [Gemmatimonadaceae bacterium]
MTLAGARLESLTNDRLLRRNVVLNLFGWGLPAIAALASIPLLARGLGPARFGLVALAWSSVSIFSLFDFGLGRALTRIVAERLAAHDDVRIADSVWAASWTLLVLTGVLAVIGVILAPSIVDRVLHVPADVRREAIDVVRLIAIAIPPLAHGVALRGVLEAAQQFRTVNQLRVPLGIATYAGPLIALPLGASAATAVAIVVMARATYWIAHFFVLDRVAPRIAVPRMPSRAALRELAQVGGWITVSNVISPIIVQADRVVVAALFPIAASGWYGTAAEVATKQWLFTAALQPVLFSALSAALKPAPARAAELMEKAARITLLALLPAAVVLTAFAAPGLRLWLGSAYSPNGAPVLRWLALAVYVNALAQVPYSVLQGGIDARSPALLHLVELPLYLALLYWLATTHGIQGVAIAWFVRMAVDG